MVKLNTKNLGFRIQLTLSIFVLVTAIPIGMMWYSSSEQILQNSVQQLFRQSNQVITSHLDDFFDEAHLVYQHQITEQQSLPAVVKQRDNLLKYLANVLAHHDEIDYFYFSSANGSLLSLGRDEFGNFIRIESDHDKAGPTTSYSTDSAGIGTEVINTNAHFDARTRQWFQRAIKTKGPVWSDIYPGAIENVLGVSLANALYDNNGNFLGVWGLDLTLSTLEHELQKNILSTNSRILLISDQGAIIASSDKDLPALMNLGTPLTPIVNVIWENIYGTPPSNTIEVNQYPLQNSTWMTAHTKYKLGEERYLTILLISPICDFIGEFINAKYYAVLFTIIAMLLAMYFGSQGTRYILKPINQLQATVKRITLGKWSSRTQLDREDELGDLSRSFDNMAEHLQETICQLKDEQKETTRLNNLLAYNNQELERKVQERTSELQNANIQLQLLANFDPLTQIANRRHFWQLFEQRSKNNTGWLLILDLDNFKSINDTYGHLVGDRVLQHFCSVCQSCIGTHALFGRIGGEEFALYVNDHDVLNIHRYAQQLLACVRNTPLMLDGNNIQITTSIGVTHSTIDKKNVYAEADRMLFKAKTAGKDRVIFLSDTSPLS
ncbi:sensor domain-containing diguanylate cyclase [Photobacterium sanguinicancri]|uniref:diguanylate cyclase n=1 Tax=Photobacterium sanguinicancri TaxID=875932 RepID=A0AAW7Y843_9GAMM|nr:diguanylate cyclase [Photobacterium sanguinicancri]MDO6542830.1 diguanylate cyclase [Photobacterium sanguinicancri]